MTKRRRLPKFGDEEQEARWVFENQNALAAAFEDTEAGHSVGEILERSTARARTRGVLLELSPTDLSVARRLASGAKLPPQDYLKRLLQKAIRDESQRLRKRA